MPQPPATLSQSEIQLQNFRQLALDNITEGILITDARTAEHLIVYANAGFYGLSGYRPEETVGRAALFFLAETATGAQIDLALGNHHFWSGEAECGRQDGSQFIGRLACSPVFDAAGDLIHYVISVVDVTAERRAEEALRKSEERMMQIRKYEAIGQLAAGVAHDFNNYLTVIRNYSAMALQRYENDPVAFRYLTEVYQAGERSINMVSQLLAYTRRQVLQPKTLNINQLIRQMQAMMRPLVGEQVVIHYHLDEELGTVNCDPLQLERVVLNLMANARDALFNGGIITVKTENVMLDQAYADKRVPVVPGDYVLLSITDNGPGIQPDVLPHIFEPYYTTKEVGKGWGLGLSTIYGIIKQSEGYIWVYSEVGAGTTFKIYLRREQALAEPLVESLASRMECPSGTETLLLVEDDEPLRTLTCELLEMCGYHVIATANGKEAIETAKGLSKPIHLVLTDVIMPQMGARDFSRLILELHPEAYLLFMSGHANDAIVHHGILDEGINFLPKPFTQNQLAAKVREVLDDPVD